MIIVFARMNNADNWKPILEHVVHYQELVDEDKTEKDEEWIVCKNCCQVIQDVVMSSLIEPSEFKPHKCVIPEAQGLPSEIWLVILEFYWEKQLNTMPLIEGEELEECFVLLQFLEKYCPKSNETDMV